MNITNRDFEILQKAIALLPHGEDFKNLNPDVQETIVNADMVLMELLRKKSMNNKRTALYIAEKRKSNKNYAR